MQMRDGQLIEGSGPPVATFQDLLLQISSAAARGIPSLAMMEVFCQLARQFFRVDGVYFWQSTSKDELIGAVANGLLAEGFQGLRLRAEDSAVTVEAVRTHQTLYVNHVDLSRFVTAAEFRARSLMAAPLMVAGDVIGAAVFLHSSDPDFFNDDLATKATILAGQLGSLLETIRLSEASHEDHRRAEILAEVAQEMHAIPQAAEGVQALADRVRIVLNVPLVCILMRHLSPSFELRAVSADSAGTAALARSRHDRKGLHFAADLARRALAASDTVSVSVDRASHPLGDLVHAGTLLAAPFRTSSSDGAILVYPRAANGFSPEDRSLLSTITSFGAVAVANAELYATAQDQAHELQELLGISSELGSVADRDQFLEKFAMRASHFLGFERAFIGLWEDGAFRVRWGAEEGESKRVDLIFPDSVASRALQEGKIFWSDDPTKVSGANHKLIAKFRVRQILAIPLLAAGNEILGVFGVLDRRDRVGISQEDIRRAGALAAHVAIALEVTRNLHLSEQHRRRADSLMRLAISLSSQLRLPEFAACFVSGAAEIAGVLACAFAVQQGSVLKVMVLQSLAGEVPPENVLCRHFQAALSDAVAVHGEAVVVCSAAELFGANIAQELGWTDCTMVRLVGTSGELTGVLCLADRGKTLALEDRQLLQAVAGHGSVALENARLFSRVEQANRHWTEIFDAITDFIVAHDESDRVLRVNRSLADFIGLEPQNLIGISAWTLLGLGESSELHSCPFCLITGRGGDEYSPPSMDRTYLLSTSRVHGASSEGLQTVHVLKDITDRREAERRYQQLFDNIQEGLFFSTPDGRFIEVNDALVRMLGFTSRQEILESDIRTQIYSSPEHHQALVDQMQQHGVLRNHEETLRRRDGSVIHVLMNAFAVRDAQDRILQYRGLMLDISGLKNFQVELQRERDFSGKILNNTQSLILVTDHLGIIGYANRRWYEMGYEQHRFLGRPMAELLAPTKREMLTEVLAATSSGRQMDNVDLQVLHGDGRIGQFSGNFSPMRDEQGHVTSIVVVMTDITDAASLQAKLMHTEKMAAVGQLVSGVAHEVNNPLTAILGFSDLLMENAEVPESARKDLRVILQEAQRTKQIVQNLLSFARQMPPQRQPVQVNPIIRRTVQLRSYDLHSRGVEVVEQLDQELPYIVGDPHQLQQVFLNIINNAYDAVRDIKRPGRIEVRSVKKSEFVEISFRDNGDGIANPERIFDPFYTTKEVGQGTGLGLSICYGIVHEHGGEIVCKNNADGGGATFLVRLPAVPGAATSAAAAGVTQP